MTELGSARTLLSLFRIESLLARCALAAVCASVFVWVGAQHLRTDIPRDAAAPPVEVAAALDAPTVETSSRPERGSASFSLDAPSLDTPSLEAPDGDPLVGVLHRLCALLDRLPPVLRLGTGSELCR